MVAHVYPVGRIMTLSRNEVQALVFKAARGGGLPLGYAEDLSAAAEFLDLGKLAQCPCQGAAQALSIAIDHVIAGDGPQPVQAEPALIAAYVAAAETAYGRAISLDSTSEGAVVHAVGATKPNPQPPAGRCSLPDALLVHLRDMAAQTLVPETESSRAAGAGAGLTDND